MSVHCKYPDARSFSLFHGRTLTLMAGIAFAGSCILLSSGPARADDCTLQLQGLPPSVRLDYDPFQPASAPARMSFSLVNPDEGRCEAELALVDERRTALTQWTLGATGLRLELRPSAGVSRAAVPSTFSVAVDPAETIEIVFDVAVVEDAVVPAGLYNEQLMLELRQPGTALSYERVPVVLGLRSLPRAQMNISGSRGDFGTGASVSVVDFGEALTGKERQIYIQARANSLARLTFRSANEGRLKLQAVGEGERFLDYTARLDDEALELTRQTHRDLALPYTYAGQALELILKLGRVEGAQAGFYSDELTIEISTL